MNIKEKENLLLLLNKYMADLILMDDENKIREKDRQKNGWKNNNQPIVGVKAQFNHARRIVKKIGTEIENEISTW